MHKDVKKALNEAAYVYENWGGEYADMSAAVKPVIEAFLRTLPNSTDVEHGVSLWYPARILAELTEEKEGE